MNLTVAQADTYFTTHLDNAAWQENDNATRLAALTMAAADVAVRLGMPEIDDAQPDQCYAVFEQAGFLARHYDRIGCATGEVAAESLDGAGSRNYRPHSHPGMSPRAMMFIRRIAGRHLTRG